MVVLAIFEFLLKTRNRCTCDCDCNAPNTLSTSYARLTPLTGHIISPYQISHTFTLGYANKVGIANAPSRRFTLRHPSIARAFAQ